MNRWIFFASVILLPLVFTSSVIYTSPDPGSYSLNPGWLAVHIDEPGCIGISFDPNGLRWIDDYVILHGECWDSNDDGVTDHGTIIVEAMRPITLVNPQFVTAPTGRRYTAWGTWRFGDVPEWGK